MIEINDLSTEAAERLSTLLVAGAQMSPVRVQAIQDPARGRVKIIVIGRPSEAADLLHTIDELLADGSGLLEGTAMTDNLVERHGVPVLICAADGPAITTPQDALDLLGAADVVAIPAERLNPGFFELRTGLAGEIMQKFVNYRTKLAVVGDVTKHVQDSESFAALVRESNRGRHVWFVDDLDGLDRRLAGPAGRGVGQREQN